PLSSEEERGTLQKEITNFDFSNSRAPLSHRERGRGRGRDSGEGPACQMRRGKDSGEGGGRRGQLKSWPRGEIGL
ncbi:hypothetical protein KKG16_03955, partial [Patescibacteria group bacterium]|nr:hypothetical protein [Patescibacteria group bacterium]